MRRAGTSNGSTGSTIREKKALSSRATRSTRGIQGLIVRCDDRADLSFEVFSSRRGELRKPRRGGREARPGQRTALFLPHAPFETQRRVGAPSERREENLQAARSGSPSERQLELPQWGAARRGRRLRCQAQLREEPRCRLLRGGRVEPAHRSAATGARGTTSAPPESERSQVEMRRRQEKVDTAIVEVMRVHQETIIALAKR